MNEPSEEQELELLREEEMEDEALIELLNPYEQ